MENEPTKEAAAEAKIQRRFSGLIDCADLPDAIRVVLVARATRGADELETAAMIFRVYAMAKGGQARDALVLAIIMHLAGSDPYRYMSVGFEKKAISARWRFNSAIRRAASWVAGLFSRGE